MMLFDNNLFDVYVEHVREAENGCILPSFKFMLSPSRSLPAILVIS